LIRSLIFGRAMQISKGMRGQASHRRTTLLTISSVLVVLAPKCPICFLAYFGIVGVATASASAYRVWLPPITVAWLLLTIATLAPRTLNPHKFAFVLVGFLGAGGVYAGKFVLNSQPMIYGGIAIIIIAALLNSWHRRVRAAEACDDCGPELAHDRKSSMKVTTTMSTLIDPNR
jgi:hypothetical protein